MRDFLYSFFPARFFSRRARGYFLSFGQGSSGAFFPACCPRSFEGWRAPAGHLSFATASPLFLLRSDLSVFFFVFARRFFLAGPCSSPTGVTLPLPFRELAIHNFSDTLPVNPFVFGYIFTDFCFLEHLLEDLL